LGAPENGGYLNGPPIPQNALNFSPPNMNPYPLMGPMHGIPPPVILI